MTTASFNRLTDKIKAYGAPRPICFEIGESPELINYLDLVAKNENTCLPAAVVEYQSRPILYLIENDRLSSTPTERKKEIRNIKQLLANRGDIAYIGVINPGQLEVYPIDLKRHLSGEIRVYENNRSSKTFFQSLALGTLKVKNQPNPDYVYNRIFKLLDTTSKHLISSPCSLKPDEVLSLIGRALFFRFLKDRNIIIDEDLKDICPSADLFEDCFSDPEKTAATSAWLDRAFNGDLLILPDHGSPQYFRDVEKKTNGDLFHHLSAIIFGAEPIGQGYQLHLWKDFDFSHIPVGILSQVYESFSNVWNPYSRSTSIYYTPRSIARYLVDESFASLKDPSNAKILDPAAGAGIFMVLAFKRLVAETWRKEGIRPDSSKIQQILYGQLSGFDINESALKLAALSLYLTAIELDADPRPLRKLRFPKPLRGKVLYYYRMENEPKDSPVIGSLGDHVDPIHNGKYDLVIGNPPWTKLSKEQSDLALKYTQVIRNVALEKGLDHVASTYINPHRNPDLPFVWKAQIWAKLGGTIALALPARILFKQSSTGKKAREFLFSSVKVTGILNCSNLSDTRVWPTIGQPFCLFFAKNLIPTDNNRFYFVSPHLESGLNSKGRIRIDSQAAEPLHTKRIAKEPWLLKTLTVGSSLDVNVLQKILKKKEMSIKEFWNKNSLKSSTGYEIRENEIQQDASAMKDYTELNKETAMPFSFFVDTDQLPPFKRDTLAWPRDIDCYKGPLFLLRQSMGEDRHEGNSLLCLKSVIYNESYYGYSGYGHKDGECDGECLVRYLYLIAYSSLFKYYVLVTSPKFACERRVIQKKDFDEFPIIPIEKLHPRDRETIWSLSEKLAHNTKKPFDEIDNWICHLYDLDDADLEVIINTIEVGLPFNQSRKTAEAAPTKDQIEIFIRYLENQLLPFFNSVNQSLSVKIIDLGSSSIETPWLFIKIVPSKKAVKNDQINIGTLMDIANEKGASQIIINGSDGLIIGLLNQYRYWTKSRARLCGLQILRDYMNAFPLPEKRK